jgi:hypothetical protein
MVRLTTFSDPVEAELARGRLQGEGIAAFVVGEIAAGALTWTNNLFGGVQLMVPAEQVERAREVLAAISDEITGEASDDASGESSTHVRTLEERSGDSPTEIRAPQETPIRGLAPPVGALSEEASPAQEGEEPAEPGGPDDDEETDDRQVVWTPDDWARRALKAAVLGYLILPGLLHLYVLYLLLRLCFTEGELSSGGMWKACAALVLSLLPLAFFTRIFLIGLVF